MTERLDLPRRYRDQIEALLREHVPGVEVWAYGSRVSGRSHEGSDLDLVLRGPDLKRIDSGMFLDLIEALEESNIPIIVQAHDWARLPESFQREIERAYVVLVMKGREDGVESEMNFLNSQKRVWPNRQFIVLKSVTIVWKVLKRYLTEELGIPDVPNSPKPILKLADENNLFVTLLDQWLAYADARIDTTHDYSGEKAEKALGIVGNFIDDAIGIMSGETWE